MGHGSYTAHDWTKLKESKRLDTGTTNEIFKESGMNPKYDPKFIGNRESRDSEDHPHSTPIIVGVDVTGSMGYLSTQIVKTSLNELMTELYSTNVIPDPQLMFAAIGDADNDAAPLQVTQFESDIRIAEQLLELWLEGRGGDMPEDYELLWYFAAKHTDIDSFSKRGEKGFCFSIGDADCHMELSAGSVRRIFDDKIIGSLTSKKLAALASEKYELFHIMIGSDPGNFTELLPGRTLLIAKSDIEYLPELIITVMLIARGMKKEQALGRLGEAARAVVESSISLLKTAGGSAIRF